MDAFRASFIRTRFCLISTSHREFRRQMGFGSNNFYLVALAGVPDAGVKTFWLLAEVLFVHTTALRPLNGLCL